MHCHMASNKFQIVYQSEFFAILLQSRIKILLLFAKNIVFSLAFKDKNCLDSWRYISKCFQMVPMVLFCFKQATEMDKQLLLLHKSCYIVTLRLVYILRNSLNAGNRVYKLKSVSFFGIKPKCFIPIKAYPRHKTTYFRIPDQIS